MLKRLLCLLTPSPSPSFRRLSPHWLSCGHRYCVFSQFSCFEPLLCAPSLLFFSHSRWLFDFRTACGAGDCAASVNLRFLAYCSTLYKSLAASALSWWSSVEDEGALRDCAGFGGGTLSSGLWYALRLAVQRAKGGEILAAKSSCIIFFFRPCDELVVLYIYIFFFTRALVVSHVLHYLGLHRIVCVRRFSSFFVCVCACVHRLCNVLRIAVAAFGTTFLCCWHQCVWFFLRLKKRSYWWAVVTEVLLPSQLNFAAHFSFLGVHFHSFPTAFATPFPANPLFLSFFLVSFFVVALCDYSGPVRLAQLNTAHTFAWCVHIFYAYLNFTSS